MMTRLLAIAMMHFLGAAAAAAGARAQPAERIEIRLERTACFGTCPVYSVTLRDDGTVLYVGGSHTRVSGSHTWTIDPAAVRALARDMQREGYFELQDAYQGMMTDHPTTYTTLTIGTRSKRIKDYVSGPKKLKEMQERIDEVAGVKKYVFITGAAIRDMQRSGWKASGEDAAAWMQRAIYAADTDVVRALLAAGFNARAADENGVTLVMRAAEVGRAETVRLLLAAGGDPAARDRSGRNAADRARDGLASGAPREFAMILKLLTDEAVPDRTVR